MIKFISKYNLSLYNILAIIWLSIQILIFYLVPYFVIPLLWFLIILFLFILIFLVFKNSRNLQFTERIIKFGFVFILFISRSEEHTSELQSRPHLVCRLLLEKKKKKNIKNK